MSADGSPKLRYKGKVTIVTGGSKGIGEGIVREFGKNLFIVKLQTLRRPLCGRMYEAKGISAKKDAFLPFRATNHMTCIIQ